MVRVPVVLIFACLLVASGGGLLEANIVGLISNIIDDIAKTENRKPQYGTYNGIKDALAMLALAIAPSAGGFLYVHYGILVNLLGSALSLVGLLIAIGMMSIPSLARLVTANRKGAKDQGLTG